MYAEMKLGGALLLLAAAAPGRTAADAPSTTPAADYVIVGGGTAGCVLAARLCAALPRATVTLLERGAPRNGAEEALVGQMRQAGETWMDPRLTEAFASAPIEGLQGRELEILTGATLGGSSAINAGQWTTPGLEEVAGWGFPGAMHTCYFRRGGWDGFADVSLFRPEQRRLDIKIS